MEQSNFSNWKQHLKEKFKISTRDTEGKPVRLREVHWLNFGWGEEVDPTTGAAKMMYHPDQLWMKKSFDRQEPWSKVNIITRTATDQPPPLYDSPIPLKPKKVKDLKAMGEKHLREPQKFFYLNLAKDAADEDEEVDEEVL